MPDIKYTIYREMVLDLIYRLHLADALFCQVTDTVVSAISMDDVPGKHQAVEQFHAYAQALQVIYADFLRVKDSYHVTFPASLAFWQWFEPDGADVIAQTLERLHAIAEGMELKLDTELLKMEGVR